MAKGTAENAAMGGYQDFKTAQTDGRTKREVVMLNNRIMERYDPAPQEPKKGKVNGIRRKELNGCRFKPIQPPPEVKRTVIATLYEANPPIQNFWKKEELDKLVSMVESGVPYKECAALLDKSEMACRVRYSRYKRRTRSYNTWTPDEEKLLFALRKMGAKWVEIGSALGRDKDACRSKYRKLKGKVTKC